MTRASVVAAGLVLSSALLQQPAADTDIYVAGYVGTDRLNVAPLVNVSRNDGYDNQPSFLPDGTALLFSSMRDGTQRDIYRYDFATGQVTQVTSTSESEYSPLVTPDGRSFSVIRVEADNTQRLWRFDLEGTRPRLVLENVKPVGYHACIEATHLALFVLGANGQPNTLQIADTRTGTTEVVDSRIGRSLHVRPGAGTVSYISKPQGAHWLVKEFDPKTRETRTLTETPDSNQTEDAAWLPNGMLVMSSGSKLMVWVPGQNGWRVAADLSASVGRVTRLAIGPSGPALPGAMPRIAVVAEPRAR
ncbi:MAG TPA: hypothetical protein VFO19_00695 [Vicinamibacterales bacterium]|nr:hypothetical protein [Vicinamibacterales bacterium]